MLKKVFLILVVFQLHFFIFSKTNLTEKVREKISSIKPFIVSFVSRVIDEGEVVVEEKGFIKYLDDTHIRWEYTEPDYKIWLLKDDKYEFFEKEENQLTKGNFKNKKRIWLWRLIHSDDIGGSVRMDIRKKTVCFYDEENGVDFKIELDSSFLPKKITQKDPTGVMIVYDFHDYRFNTGIKIGDLIIKYPKGTEIVEIK